MRMSRNGPSFFYPRYTIPITAQQTRLLAGRMHQDLEAVLGGLQRTAEAGRLDHKTESSLSA
jgi:hypothetical protein